MTLQSKSFTINKGGTLEVIAQFLEREIGLNAFLIRGIKGVPLSTEVTQLTVLYEKYSPEIVDSIAPREGALFTTGVSSDDFDIRFLFNEPVDAQSIASGTFSIDGQALEADKVFVDPTTNNYFLKISASGAGFQSNAFHTYQVNDSLRRQDGSSYNYTPVGGYIFHGIASAHLGDYPDEYISRRRGKLAVGVVKLSKNINPQQGISEFLSQRQLSDNRLITYTPISTSTNTVDVYFIYIRTLEPQIISGFPLDNSLLPDVSAPSKVTFVFNTQLDSSKLAATTGLFSIEEGFTTSTDVPPENVTLLPDNQTVEIDTTSYFTSQRVYSILAKPGIRSLEGLDKEKPEQWTVHIAPYEASGGVTTGVSQQDFDDFRALFDAHTGDPSIHYETGDILLSTGQVTDLPPIIDEEAFIALSGAFTGHTGEAFVSLSSSVTTNTNSISTNVTNIGINSGEIVNNANSISTNTTNIATNTSDINSLTADFTGHTGINSIHYTQSEITNLNVNQLAPGSEGYILTVDAGSASWQPPSVAGGGISTGEFTGHTGDLTIHYAQSDIFLDPGQINTTDVPSGYFLASTGGTTASFQPAPAGAAGFAGLSGDFTGHTGETGIHYLMDEIEILVDQVTDFNPADYTTNAAFAVHTGSGEIHFLQSDITISASQITDVEPSAGYATLPTFTGHTGETGIHFLESDISHFNISDIGSNTHAQIDTHIGDDEFHFLQSEISIGVSQISDIASNYAKLTGFTGHTGETGIHFTQSQIQITTSQITDINQYALDSEVNSLSAKVDDISGNYTGHTGETGVHYTQAEITLLVSQLDANTTAGYVLTSNGSAASWSPPPAVSGVSSGVFAAHTGDADIHFLEGDINHLNITNIGVNSHAAIDTHIADMTGHTGEPTIHYTQAEIEIGAAQIDTTDVISGYVLTATGSGPAIFQPVSVAASADTDLSGDFTGHTGDSSIHFTQGEISIDTSQLTDFDVADFTGHTGETGVHYTQAEISDLLVSQLDGSEGLNTYVITTNGTTASWQPPAVTEAEFNSLSGTVDTNTNSISTNTTAIAANSGDILTNINSINTNTTAIAANSGDLVSAVADIAINSGDIANVSAYNTSQDIQIIANNLNIAANSGRITANSGDIQANITAIAANSGDLVLAVADIAINSGEIINNTNAISANSGDLLVAINDIAINSGEIVTNTNSISTNTTAIAANSGDIQTNIVDIASNLAAIQANSGDILTNISDISTNAAAIAANSGDIIENETYTTNVSGQLNTKIGTNTANIGAVTTYALATRAIVTGHTGDPSIHFEQSDIFINADQINTAGVTSGFVLTATGDGPAIFQAASSSPSPDSDLSGDFTGHTGDSTIHFTKASISLGDLSDVTLDSPSEGEILRYGESTWSNYNTGGEGLGTDTPIEDLQNVEISYSAFSGGTTPSYDDVLYSGTPSMLGWNEQSGLWTDFELLVDLPLQMSIYQGTGGIGPALGQNTFNLRIQPDYFLQLANDLSEVPDKDTARRNLKARYQIEDFITTTFINTTTETNGNGSPNAFLFNMDSASFMQSDPSNFGVYAISSDQDDSTGDGGIIRSSNKVGYLIPDLEYYFRVAIDNTNNNIVRFGLTETVNSVATTGAHQNAVYFEYNSTTDTTWHACTASGSTITRVNTNYTCTANQWEWLGFMPVSSGIYFFEYDNGTTSDESDAIAFIGATGYPEAGSRGMRLFCQQISNGAKFRKMYIDKFAYPLYLDYLPSGLAARF